MIVLEAFAKHDPSDKAIVPRVVIRFVIAVTELVGQRVH